MQDGYRLDIEPHRFFFVDKFYNTDYRKASKYAPMGSRIFDLTDVLQTTSLPPVADIAKKLTQLTWQ